MSGYIRQIRETIDSKLAAMAAKADALGAQLAAGKREAQERIERRMQALRESLDHLKAELERQGGLAEGSRKKLVEAIDELKVQIALGKADALDALEVQGKKIAGSIARFEAEADHQLAGAKEHLDAAYEAVTRRYVHACDALEAELEAAGERLKEEMAYHGVDLERHKRELNEKVTALKQQIAEQRKHYSEKWQQFQSEIEPGLTQIAKAFKSLFS
jgi:uncharacterized protein YaaN involved in tellurite resistance